MHSQQYNTTKMNKQEVIFVKVSGLILFFFWNLTCVTFSKQYLPISFALSLCKKNDAISKLFITNEGQNALHVDHEIPLNFDQCDIF